MPPEGVRGTGRPGLAGDGAGGTEVACPRLVLTAPSRRVRGEARHGHEFLTRPRTFALSGDVRFAVIVCVEPAGNIHSQSRNGPKNNPAQAL